MEEKRALALVKGIKEYPSALKQQHQNPNNQQQYIQQ